MNTKNIIFGSLALVILGGGAYFFLKNKKKKDTLKLEDLKKLGDSVTQTGSATTPDKVLDSAPVTNTQAQAQANQQELINLTQATSLINQILTLRKTKKTIPPFNFGNMNTWASESNSISVFNQGVENQIANLKEQMKLLGYKEENGLAVKI
jgi:hypothetical protein